MHPALHGVLLSATVIFMIVGLAGTIIPMVPGCLLIFGLALLYGLLTGFERIGAGPLVALGVIAAAVQVTDYIAVAMGVKKFGGGRQAIVCAMLGGIVGAIVFNIPGLIIGALIGATAGELATGRKLEESARTGVGTLVGFLAGTLVRLTAAVVMIGIFMITVLRG